MQKLIRTSAIVAVALKAAASTLILMSYFFHPIIVDLFYNSSPSDGGSIFLIFIQSLWSLSATIPLLFCCGKQKGRIVLELIVFGLLLLVLPAVNTLTSVMFTNVIARTFGASQVAAYSIANSIASYCTIPGNWGTAVAYAACGMSIVYKLMSKKQESVLAEN